MAVYPARLPPIEGDPAYLTVRGREEPYFDYQGALRLMFEAEAINIYQSCLGDEAPLSAGLNTSDLFAWGYSDWFKLQLGHVEPLYHEWRKNPTWGPIIWVLKRYNRQPQPPLKEAMVEDGAWPPELDALDANEDGTMPENYD